MDMRVKISTGRAKDWEAREAAAEREVRQGHWPGEWRPEDRARTPGDESQAPEEQARNSSKEKTGGGADSEGQ
ncbi:MAG: hypothetical protein WBE26_12335 [Phycisphaerae bacterium]